MRKQTFRMLAHAIRMRASVRESEFIPAISIPQDACRDYTHTYIFHLKAVHKQYLQNFQFHSAYVRTRAYSLVLLVRRTCVILPAILLPPDA